ncbi:MAG TPA: L,D-transpeptidase family protein [Rhizomicrobium sp.]|jgi:L,D-peptidoglycan transpeptidase YkuD (ErfK/YbiS/YcfS/YnhG family)|nr:L,D-transpeptidase family protein [Rhizomicrobium sp.]
MNLILAGRRALGRCGAGIKQCEGDGVTPRGTWPARRVLYRADKLAKPQTALPIAAIAPGDGWCDAPDDPAYNTQVTLPFPAGHERLWRDDDLYDLVVVLGFNDDPVVPGAGSAIFLHVARPDFGPTEGCVAFALSDLLAIVARLSPGDTVTITP